MSLSYTHGREFVSDVRPILEANDPDSLIRHLSRFWPNTILKGLFTCGHHDAAKTALFCLSLTGDMPDNPEIAPMLHDDDATVSAMAEHALWSIWFRGGDCEHNTALLQAVQLIGKNELDEAIAALDRITLNCPTFSEAYNQRAIVYFLKEDFIRAMADCNEALRLNPHHFGALAGTGHCHAALGHLDQALDAYCAALQLHPRLEGIRQSIRHIRESQSRTAQKTVTFDPPDSNSETQPPDS